jgi:hypothetical protein
VVCSVIKDHDLAEAAQTIEAGSTDAAKARALIRDEIERRYTSAAKSDR